MSRDFRSLKIWEKSHEMVLLIYSVTKEFPSEEKYGLISQLRRAALSVPTNIAEGCGYDSEAQMSRFLMMSLGSASELEYLLLVSNDLQILAPSLFEKFSGQIVEIKKMILSFNKNLKANS